MRVNSNVLAKFFNFLGDALEEFNPSAFRFLSAVLPYLTPVPVAWITAQSASEFLHFTPTIAFIFVFGLEGIGLWFTSMLVDAIVDWIRSRNAKSFVPVLLFVLAVASYVYILVNLNVTLEKVSGNSNETLSKVITLMCFLPLITGIGNGYYKLKLETRTQTEQAKLHEEERQDRIRQEKNNLSLEKYKIKHGNLSESSKNLPKDSTKVSVSFGKVSETLPKDWRKLRKLLELSDVERIARLSADGVRKLAAQAQVDERTIINWRKYAREELGIK